MSSVMAIVSKAVFEKEARGLGIGDVWTTDRYASNNKGLAALEGGGDLYLVTVRPPEVFCLVAVLKAPKHGSDGYRAKANTVAIKDISAARTKFQFAGGAPLPTKKGTLGMSLQTPRVLTDADLELLGGDAPAASTKTVAKAAAKTSVAPAKPAKPAKAAKPAKPTKVTPAAKVSLGGIRRELAAGNPGDALPALLALWRTEPSAELAKQIAMVSAAATVELPALEGKSPEVATVWNRLAKAAAPEHIPALLATVADATSANAAKRMKLVLKWPPDPRLDAAVAGWLEVPPFHALMTQPFWGAVFELGRRVRDPAQLPRLEAADALIAKGVAATMSKWLRERLATLVDELRPIIAEVPTTTSAVAELASAAAAVSVDTSDLETLLAAVYADPLSDGPRLVYADALSERGDVRGEFIAVQCRLAESPGDPELVARERELLAANGKKWLGELSRIVMSDYRFERGFLAWCRIDENKRAAATAVANHPIWSTVHTHDGPLELALSPVMKSLRAITYRGWSEEDSDDDGTFDASKPAAWKKLLVDHAWPFETLTYRSGGDRPEAAMKALAECKGLPQLRTLIIDDDPEAAAPLFDAPVLARLDMFGLEFAPDRNRGWEKRLEPLLEKAPVRTLRIELTNSSISTLATLKRSDAKKPAYTEADVEISPTSTNDQWNAELVDELLAILKRAPKLQRLTIVRRGKDQTARAYLERAVKRLGVATWSIL